MDRGIVTDYKVYKVITLSQANTESMMITTSLQLSKQLFTRAFSGDRQAIVIIYISETKRQRVTVESVTENHDYINRFNSKESRYSDS